MINKDMKLIPKAQYGAQFIAQSDNTKVPKPQIILPFKLSAEQKARIRQQLADLHLEKS